MVDPDECPNCGSFDTRRQHTTWLSDSVKEVRTCNDCPTEYTVGYAEPRVTETRYGGEL